MKCQLFIDILLLLGVVYLFSMCANNDIRKNYDINYYIDTVQDNIILTTVCDNKEHISISTIKLN